MEDKRSLLAAGLSMLVLVVWFLFFTPKTPETPPVPAVAPSAPSAESVSAPGRGDAASLPAAPASSTSSAPVIDTPEVLTEKETPLVSMTWTNRGGRLTKILLKDYREGVKKDSPPTNLLSFQGERSLNLLCDGCSRPLPEEGLYRLVPADSDRSITFEAEQEGLIVRKHYEWSDDQYLFQMKLTVENRSDRPFQGRLGLGWTAKQFEEGPKGFMSFLRGPENQRGFLYMLGKKVEHVGEKEESLNLTGAIPWAGIEDRYFLIALISRRISSDQSLHLKPTGDQIDLSLFPSGLMVPPQGTQEESYSFYLGPKERHSLKAAGVGLEEAIDYGWFSLLAIPILELLKIFHAGVRNWGVAVILLTLFAKLLMNPLTVRSMKQMKGMQALQPKLAAFKEKYKNDKQRLNTETMALFRTHKVNPMGGCLPMILQMPIYIALYKVLYNSIELYHAPFFWFYRDLSAPDPYFILPILLGLAMVAQQKLTPTASADPAQKQMMMFMPIMFTAFMLFLPMGLVLYIFVNTLFSVIQQWMYQNDLSWRDLLKGNLKKAPAKT